MAPNEAAGKWAQAAWRIGVDIAGPAADDVDRHARFPHETVDALKAQGFLSALLPVELGGGGAALSDLMGAVRALATHCASSALVLAMHSIETFNLGRHGSTPALEQLAREVSSEKLLLANAYSEVGIGGDVGRSICGLDDTHSPWTLDKQALAISYGEHADVVLTPARRSLDAMETDQILILSRRPQFQLEPTSEWDTLGLRGTCSRGFLIRAEISPDMVFPVPFATVANNGGGQARQLLLSAVWIGLAETAAAKAHAYVQAAARKTIGTVPPSALRLAEIASELQAGRSLLAASALRFEVLDGNDELEDPGFTVALRSLKVATSSLALSIATAALGVCGIVGYRREGPFTLDRIIRDAHGGLIMVNNDRYLNDNAQLLLARKLI